MTQKFDAIVIGTGQSGPSIAARMTKAGHEGRHHRAQALRRHLRQRRLHSHQDAGRERPRRARRAPRRGFRRDASTGESKVDMKARQGAQGRDRRATPRQDVEKWLKSNPNLTVFHGHGRFESPTTRSASTASCSKRRRSSSTSAAAPACPTMPGRRRDRLPDQLDDDGRRLPARAPDRRRRQLHRAGVRADVSALRQPRDASSRWPTG